LKNNWSACSKLDDSWEIAVASSSEGVVSFINKFATYKRQKTCCLYYRPGYQTFHSLPKRVGYQVTLKYKTIMKHVSIFVNCSMMNTENLTDECFQQCTPSGRFFTGVKNLKKIDILFT
jgi:hypothetical protein